MKILRIITLKTSEVLNVDSTSESLTKCIQGLVTSCYTQDINSPPAIADVLQAQQCEYSVLPDLLYILGIQQGLTCPVSVPFLQTMWGFCAAAAAAR